MSRDITRDILREIERDFSKRRDFARLVLKAIREDEKLQDAIYNVVNERLRRPGQPAGA